METIKRQSMLYKTGVEYGDYTLNHVQGCAHGCKYPCYAMQMAKRFGKVKTYEEWCEPKIVENTLEILDKEIPKLKNKIKSVHLCFTTDPFMYKHDDVSNMSIEIINKLNNENIKCSVLTKGILPIKLSSFSKDNEYGITLVSLDEGFRQQFEPYSANYTDRIEALKALHDAGCYTWVSIEPYPTPNIFDQNINDILESIKFVDKIIFGRMHYNKEITAYKEHKAFFNSKANEVIEFCQKNHIEYHIKNGTITN